MYIKGIDAAFMNPYNVLQALPHITYAYDTENGSFVMLSNDLTHEPMLLQKPSYTPEMVVDNSMYDINNEEYYVLNGVTLKMETEFQNIHYQTNMAAMILLGQWFEYLKGNDVYDNTRIILVSDHGQTVAQIEELYDVEGLLDYEVYMPLLMVKDFDAKE